jgi:MFS family permease
VIAHRLRRSSTFSSLEIRNYRLYFSGQIVSLAGTWMQTVAQGLLVVKLNDSATVLGLVVATQMMPVLLFGLWAGVVADRIPKRTLLVVTQVLAAACAFALGLLVATGAVRLWMVFVLAFLLGVVQAFDNPARQSFVSELVPPHRLANAIGLNSVMVNLARIVGPSVAGVLSATVGLATCFFVNAVSYVAVIVALVLIRRDELRESPRSSQPGQLRQGLAYVRNTPVLFLTLVLMGVVGTLAYEFPVTLPIVAKKVFGNEDLYGPMSALQGVGAVVGALWVASRFTLRSPSVLAVVAVTLGAFIFAIACAPTLAVALVLIVVMGAASIAFISIGNTVLQLEADPSMRGRVMALWSIALIGSTTVGGPFVGWIADVFGARAGLGLGGVAAVVAGAATYPALRRLGHGEPPEVEPRALEPVPQDPVVGGILPSPPS